MHDQTLHRGASLGEHKRNNTQHHHFAKSHQQPLFLPLNAQHSIMPSSTKMIKNPFKRKTPANKNKVVLKKADKHTTEISIARVDKSQVSPAPPTTSPVEDHVYTDVPTLQYFLKQRNEQIASLKNEMAELKMRVAELEEQSMSCSCGAYQRPVPIMKSNFSKW
jgi:hypothetical protein